MEAAAPWFRLLCVNHGFENEADALATLLSPSIALMRTDADASGLGRSRIGGGPDVPADFVWPESGGRALDFVLQVNLADVPEGPGQRGLPGAGVLSFFYDFEKQPSGNDAADRSGHRVHVFGADELVQRRPAADSELALAPAALAFKQGVRLPHPFSADGERGMKQLQTLGIAWGEDEAFRYFDLVSAVAAHHAGPGKPLHAMGGYSHNVQGDMQRKAESLAAGSSRGGSNEALTSLPVEGTSDPCRWKLLLQLDSDDEDEMWGDSGMLYYWIRTDDLHAGVFSRTWLMQQSC